MSDNSIYQEARSHLAYLRMAAAAEALPAELEYATTQKLGHTAFLKRLLEVEVSATEIRRRASLERFASLPSPFRLEDFDFDAQPSIDKKLVNEPGHPALPRGRHQRVVHRTTRCGQDHVGGGSRPGFHRYGLSDVLPTAADLVARCHRAALEGRWATTMCSSPDRDCWSSMRSVTCHWPTRRQLLCSR